MWSAYLLIESGIQSANEKYLLHEVIKIMEGIRQTDFKKFLALFYGTEFYVGKNPGDFAVMFIKSIKQSNMILFSDLIKTITNGNPR